MQEFRPMSISDILDRTFRLYRDRFVTFLLIALTVYIPFALVASLLLWSMGINPNGFVETSPAGDPQINALALLAAACGFLVLVVVLIPLCSAALTENISAAYLGHNLSAGESYQRALPRLAGLIGSQLLAGLVILAGFCMLFVPGIIFSLWFSVLAPVVIIEGLSGTAALGRSRELMRGNIGKAFVLMFLTGLIANIVVRLLGVAISLIPWPHPVLSLFLQTVSVAIVLPIQTAPLTLLYYDLRIRKEAFDLEMLSTAMAQPAIIL